ncbi:hypothetical protein OG455_10605 [Kitasatospora sp. NBC_01287]|uniref:hypothetical protein n=1 Tax=Kitasatospora sp. NBC_01287 TaxID=2903573 RepID=UPI002252D87A|nr:hypothetical protein [Kitasatospora sp. NBC_01287]MCX4745970.1 hypothetical protein [Kitasatospora sp. NBC_01287]
MTSDFRLETAQWETWAVLRDTTAERTDRSVLLVLQQLDFQDAAFRTIQLAHFASHGDAEEWIEGRATHLVPATIAPVAVPQALIPAPGERSPVIRPEKIHAARTRTIHHAGPPAAAPPAHRPNRQATGRSR